MKIYALSVVKNEADVIEANLKAASKWADKIFVWDNGSTDGTWEKIQALADDIITPWKQDARPFRDSLRSMLYNAHKHWGKPGDWWCIKLDADEFYYDDPRQFLAKIPLKYHYVCSRYIQLMITEEDIAEYQFTGSFEEDREKINYFHKLAWAEIRFVRHRDRLAWTEKTPFPEHVGIVYPELITMLHYQHRSPQQIQRRLTQRKEAIAKGGYHSPHITQSHWREVLRHRKDLYHLKEGIDLHTIPAENKYLHQPHKLFIKRLLHGLKILP
ncbi:MAG: family 2 glycosyl transferase [Sphingobacteriales bacterium]|nr:MAG: family 2 glycosyl transferase [Sphingobacteriales bacterium]